ncbi:MAG: hypothetical protein MI862_26115 [Desulfobacterales bacterium]|nr:hypothetical protein [Desulfobacterales bacterium]
MNKQFFSVMFLAVTALVAACISTGNRPTVCNQIEEPSILCQVATEHGVRLEDVGNGLILVNALAISEGVYTRADARQVLSRLLDALDGSITYAVFKSRIQQATESFPGLLDVAKSYLDEFSLSNQMYDADREILQTWLTNRIKSL